MSSISADEAPLPGVQPEEILRAFYAEVEPGKQNLEKAIRQVLKEVDYLLLKDKPCYLDYQLQV